MMIVGFNVIEKFEFNKREVLELVSLPVAIPWIFTILVTSLQKGNFFTIDTLFGLIFSPLVFAFVILFMLPVLLLPTLIILILKQNFIDKPMFFFFISTLTIGILLSILSFDFYMVVVGMGLTLLSTLVQYYYFDKNRKLGVKNECKTSIH